MAYTSKDFRDWVLLAEGGEAEVFRAQQVSLFRHVAVKRLKYAAMVNSGAIRRFGTEARLSAALQHPSLVQVMDYGQDGPYWCIVMEYVDGIDLGKLLAGNDNDLNLPELPMGVKCHIARQIVEVMEFLHSRQVVHRDLKPENMMIDRQGRVKLLDLGLARSHPLLITDPQGTSLKGTLGYLAPELLRGQGPYTSRSEWYALGLLLMELFGQRRLFHADTANEVLGLIQQGAPQEAYDAVPERLRPHLSPFLSTDPADRPESLRPLLEVLQQEEEEDTEKKISDWDALAPYISLAQSRWLWREIRRARADGQIETAFQRAKELIEILPDDSDAQSTLVELGSRLNETPTALAVNNFTALSGRNRKKVYSVLAVLLVILVSILLLKYQLPRIPEDMGAALLQRQGRLLENDPSLADPDGVLRALHKPKTRAYGVLVVEGLPKGYRYRINGNDYRPPRPIQLPEDRYLLEIRDEKSRQVMSDSIQIAPGEPTIFQFDKEGKSSDSHS